MDILCLGTLTVDVFVEKGDSLPVPDVGPVFLLDNAEVHPGGTAVNTSLDLAKLGVPVGVATRVGVDPGGEMVLQHLKNGGIQLSSVTHDQAVNTTMTIYIKEQDGQLGYLYYPGTSAVLCEDDVDMALVTSAKFLHVGGTFLMPSLDGAPTARILKAAKEAGVVTSLDPTPNLTPDSLSIISPSLPYLDYFLPNLGQAKAISGLENVAEIADFLLDRGVGTVGLKMGKDGCYIKSKDQTLHLPSFKVEEVEVTGAGDAFVAGILTGLWHGWELEKAGRIANAVGAMCVQGAGAQAGVGSIEDTLQFMARTEVHS